MGLFDSILQKMKCFHCGKTSIMEFQTKEGMRSLRNYKLGDRFEFNPEDFVLEKESIKSHSKPKYLISLLGSCHKCNTQYSGLAWINPQTLLIEELEVYTYTVDIEPVKIFMHEGVK